MKTTVAIKGTKTGLVVTLAEEPPFETVIADLADRLQAGSAFFQDARLTLNVGARPLAESEWHRLRDLLAMHGVVLQNVASTSDSGRQEARAAGLALVSAGASAQLGRQEARTVAVPWEGSEGLLIKRNLRSGQVVRHPGHVVILGDLHPGAEIIAGGDIVVWGALRGIAHAGALGDAEVGIYALHLAPTQLRIAEHMARSPERGGDQAGPEAARVEGGHIVVEAWGRGK